MKLIDISLARLFNQQIAATKFNTAKDIVAWMGALQAQDHSMSKWAIGVRLPNSTNISITNSIDSGEVLRTHVMRPTFHLVSPDDIYWMLELTAPQIKALMKPRDRLLCLDEKDFNKCNTILEQSLRDGNHLSREELMVDINKNAVAADNNRLTHLLMRAEIEGVICSGKSNGNKRTYALLPERAKKRITLTKDVALAKLAQKYFASHSPATLQDFTWWSGLSVSESKQALEMIKPDFISEKIGDQTYWLNNFTVEPLAKIDNIFFLPAFDEFIVSYKDRKASISSGNFSKIVTTNGIFRPTIVSKGEVVGTWRQETNKEKVLLKSSLFIKTDKDLEERMAKAATPFLQFMQNRMK